MDWLTVALTAPFLWAIVSVIDNYFVNDVYEDAYDGIIISSFFQFLPWALVPLGILHFSFSPAAAPWAFGSGYFFLAALFFYFRSLFLVNDSAFMQILWSLSVPLVPFFAWFMIGERLLPIYYLGMLIAFLGVLLFNFNVQKGSRERLKLVARPMMLAVIFMAFSMVVGKKAFLISGDVQSNFLLFCLGALGILLTLALIDPKNMRPRWKRAWILSKRNIGIFALAEGLSVIATLTSQWAIKLTPAISFVALIESLVPVFVVLFSLLLIVFVKYQKRDVLERIYSEQLVHMRTKVIATLLIAIGIYTIS